MQYYIILHTYRVLHILHYDPLPLSMFNHNSMYCIIRDLLATINTQTLQAVITGKHSLYSMTPARKLLCDGRKLLCDDKEAIV